MAFTKIFKSKKSAPTPTTRSAASTPRASRENLRGHNNPIEVFEKLHKTNAAWARTFIR
ncbi:hypothetical protein FBU31_003920 [Coemansia sp. 'formosensis']|uniref:Uncharacterized protein n=1 Tax=Coemansia furcata TaxID=417177 RepID=A0ACC1LDL0_9FUNG|nr:hypothetical protein H4S07_003780 [Coemansia furcata]KAJ2821097.1 hypothetical protein GGI24_004310 [Coemansia furcata]KAJ2824708.1 hypothetical protein FBU31_003920 [Coemansia sp. 'formosensis']